MLIKDFYTLKEINKVEENEYEAFIHLNKDHAIFKGHFPGKPITPGVCMIQIVKELTSKIVDKQLFLKSSRNIKFMALINPETNSDLKLTLAINEEDSAITVRNTCYFDDTVALRMSMNYEVL